MYRVKTSDGKDYDCKAYQINTLSAFEHEVIIEGYTGNGEAGARKLISVSDKPRQGTDPHRCTSVGVYNQDGDLIQSVHSDGSASDAQVIVDGDTGEEVTTDPDEHQ